MTNDIIKILSEFVPKEEGFSSVPVWDYKQWSWGYGTAAGYNKNVKPSGTITRQKALADSLEVHKKNYNYLLPKVKRKLKANEWAALLSFAYNLGAGVAEKLLPNINSNNTSAVVNQMKKYVLAGGVKLPGLVKRRNNEAALYAGNSSANTVTIVSIVAILIFVSLFINS